MRLTPTLALGLISMVSACSAPVEESDTGAHEDEFAVFDVLNPSRANSLLTTIASSGGRVRACIGLVGFGTRAAEAGTTFKTRVAEAATKWNDLLTDNPDWSISRIEFTFTVQNGACPKTSGDMRVNAWATRAQYEADVCARRPGGTCAANTEIATRTINVGPVNRGVDVDVFDGARLVHEYGHAIGLADTYKVPGSHDWSTSNQPASVMNGKSRTLTEDDKLGVWLTWRTLRIGVRTCDGYGGSVAFTQNVWNSVMCDPNARPASSHGGRTERDADFFVSGKSPTFGRAAAIVDGR